MDGVEEQELIDMRAVVVPPRNVGRHPEGVVTEIVNGPRPGIEKRQHSLQGDEPILEQLSRFPTQLVSPALLDIVQPEEGVDEAVEHVRARGGRVLFVPNILPKEGRQYAAVLRADTEQFDGSQG